MSADNWTDCPRCNEKLDQEFAEASAKVIEGYGKLPLPEWEALKSSVQRKHHDVNLREDYEIGIRKGVFAVSYGASCSMCGFQFTYHHTAVT